VNASHQVVAGSLYRFNVIFLVGGTDVNCKFEVLEQGWMDNGRTTKAVCDNQKNFNLIHQPVGRRNKN